MILIMKINFNTFFYFFGGPQDPDDGSVMVREA